MTDNAKSIIVELRAACESQRKELGRIDRLYEVGRQEMLWMKHHVIRLLGWVNYVQLQGYYSAMSEAESESLAWLAEATAEHIERPIPVPAPPSTPADSAPH